MSPEIVEEAAELIEHIKAAVADEVEVLEQEATPKKKVVAKKAPSTKVKAATPKASKADKA